MRDTKLLFTSKSVKGATLKYQNQKIEIPYTNASLTYDLYGTESKWQSTHFSIHSMAEHKMRDRHSEAELQLYFKGITHPDEVAVVSLLLNAEEKAPSNVFFDNLRLKELNPGEFGIVRNLNLNPGNLYASLEDANKLSYMGSLTAPPCLETALWFIYDKQATISMEQFDILRNLLHRKPDENNEDGNNRKLMEAGSRYIWYVGEVMDDFEFDS